MQDKEKEIKVYYSKKIINSQRKAARKEEEQKTYKTARKQLTRWQ